MKRRRLHIALDSKLLAAVLSLVTGVSLSWVLHSPWSVPNIYSDVLSFWSRPWFAAGQIPYIDDYFEYPPICGAIVYFARIVGGNGVGYYEIIGIFSGVAAAVIGWSCWRIAKASGNRLNYALLIMPSVIFYGIYSFDLFQAAFIMLSVQFALEKRQNLSAIATALGILTKVVNVVLLPVFLIELKGKRNRIKYLVLTAAVLLLFELPLAYLNFNTWIEVFTSNATWGLEDAWYVWIFQNPATLYYAKYFGASLGFLLLLRVYTLKVPMVQKCLLALAAYMLSTSVYDPQVNLILIPFVAILAIESPSYYFWDIFNVMIILTWFTWPNPVAAGTVPQTMALLRDLALVWLSAEVVRTQMRLRDALPAEILGHLPHVRNRTEAEPGGTIV